MMADVELDAMGVIHTSLETLPDDEAKLRVLSYVADRHGLALTNGQKLNGGGNDGDVEDVVDDNFKFLGELLDAASPSTEAEYLLVAGYWLQVVGGAGSFKALDLNKELTPAGHAVSSIGTYMGINVKKKLMTQVGKAKGAKGHRSFKLSNAGIAAVKSMINGKSA